MEKIEYISEEEKEVCEQLVSLNQEHLIKDLNKFPKEEREKFIKQVSQEQSLTFFIQIKKLDKVYSGGIKNYMEQSKKLLKGASEDVNPYEGFQPSIPKGQSINFQNFAELEELETEGLKELKDACFVLVAGGLGERLGYDSIKVGIPIEVVNQTTFLQYYIENILAFQKVSGAKQIPLAIMVSDDTKEKTIKFLKDNNNFGMEPDQIQIMKQQKLPAMIDNEARFSQIANSLLIETKPHGHGDVHVLLHQKGLAQKWLKEGKKWVLFFQDTNPLVFRSYAGVLGVSKKYNLEVNSITVPRKPGEPVGSLCCLTNTKTQQKLTVNVEYNQAEGLFKATGGEAVDEQGYSVYPGNINSLVFSLPEYSKVLEDTQGLISEFINPKYADASKTKFKAATRLECMMQDYPKLLPSADRVGITQIEKLFCFSTVKNDLVAAKGKYEAKLSPESASSCEQDFYRSNAKLLQNCGVEIGEGELQTFAGIGVKLQPQIIIKPSFGCCFTEIKKKIKGLFIIFLFKAVLGQNKISGKSTVIFDGDFTVENIDIDGAIHLKKDAKDLTFKEGNYLKFEEIDVKSAAEPSFLKIRGYKITNPENLKVI